MDRNELSGAGDPVDGSEILRLLQKSGQQLVLAESCTAGLIAATLAETPSMSRHLCGSLVVYQIASKLCWLGLSPGAVTEANVVSRETAERMAEGALRQTPHATLSVAITGHLGPGAPPELDGTAWVAILFRGSRATCHELRLPAVVVAGSISLRIERQRQAVRRTLDLLLASLQSVSEPQ
jgi:nicotinamide-nucleotide amidase